MSKLSNTGHLMCLYLDYIDNKKNIKQSDFLVSATANLINQGDGRNWLPLIVKKIDRDKYELIANSFAYQVAKEANLERVWCIIADGSQETSEISQILMGEKIPKINLSIASKEEISQAIEYLFSLPHSELKSIGRGKQKLIDNISNSPIRKYWQDLKAIRDLKCGIGNKGKKLDEFKKVFYLTPEPIPMDTRDKNILNSLTLKELKNIAKARKLKGYSRLNKSQLVDLLSSIP